MESQTYIKNVDISPKKLRFMAPTIKTMTPVQAVAKLAYSPQKASRVFYKAIQSAIASARQTLKVSDDLLEFKTLLVEEGQKLRRYRPAGRGGVHQIKKRFAHIKIVLESKSAGMTTKVQPATVEAPQEAEIVAESEVKAEKKETKKTKEPKTEAKKKTVTKTAAKK